MPRWLKTACAVGVGAIGLGASILAYVQISKDTWRKIGDFLYPEVLIALLGVLLLIAIVVIAVMGLREKRSFDPAEQDRVNRVLSTLPRVFMDNIGLTDIVAPWRDEVGYPLAKFVNEDNGPESELSNPKLEQQRQRLKSTAARLAHAEAAGIDHRQDGFRFLGITDHEASEDPAALERLEARAATIRSAATQFREAHDDFVREARRQKLDTSRLSDAPPQPPWER